MNANVGYCYILARRYPKAIALLRKAVELDPNFPYTHGCLCLALLLNDGTEAAIAEWTKAREVRPGNYHAVAFLAYTYGLKGNREKALQLRDQAKEIEQRAGTVWAYGDAVMALGLGEKSQAIDWLERSYEAKETGAIGDIKVNPLLDPLRGDPRFEKLANQIVPPVAKEER